MTLLVVSLLPAVAPSPASAALRMRPAPATEHAHAEGAAVRLTDGRVLVVGGGRSVEEEPFISGYAEVYDPSTNMWAPRASMATPRIGHTATRLPDGRVLVVGGGTREAELYRPDTNTWSPAAPMRHNRSYHDAVLLPDGRVLVVGGIDNPATDNRAVEIYTPATDSWSAAAPVPGSSYIVDAALAGSGKVLVTLADDTPAQLFDPATDSWRPTGSGTGLGGMAARLRDGRVLVVFHTPGRPSWLQAAIYDTVTDTWTPTSRPLHSVCYLDSVTTLTTGRVLLLCPDAGHGSGLSFGQAYLPSVDRWADVPSVTFDQFAVTPLLDGGALLTGGQRRDYWFAATMRYVEDVQPLRLTSGGGPGSATVAWEPPTDLAGLPIRAYTVTNTRTGQVRTVSASTRAMTFTGLANGVSYPLEVRAVTDRGAGSPMTTHATPTALPCTIRGTAGADLLTGTGGRDVICGLGGDDHLRPSGGDDVVRGGPGVDTVDVGSATRGVTVDLAAGTATGQGSDVLREIENVLGTSYADKLIGDVRVNDLFGRGGKDTLRSRGTGEVAEGGPSDRMYGGDGDDELQLTGLLDEAVGGPGVDAVTFPEAPGICGEGVRVDLSLGVAEAGDGFCTWDGSYSVSGIENVVGTPYVDAIWGSAEANLLRGAGADDSLIGGGGNDRLAGDGGGDFLSGHDGFDTCGGGGNVGTSDRADDTCEVVLGVP